MEHPASAPDHIEARGVDHADSPDITLDNLVGLVEKAARIVDYLQKENAVLVDDVKDHQAALQSATAKAAMLAERIRELESDAEQWRRDAQWCRWFQQKYRDSTFFSHIEREYMFDHSTQEANANGNGDALAA